VIAVFKKSFRNLGASIIDFLYPKICIISGKRISPENSNSFIDDSLLLKLEAADSAEFREYKAALNAEFFFSKYIFRHDNEIQTLIHYLKYKGFTIIGEFLGEETGHEIIIKHKDSLKDFHYLLPVPLFASKLRERGYNQSYQICMGLNKMLNLELIEKKILRTKNTKSQTGLSYEERVKNVRDAFTLSEESIPLLMNKGIIIVDDVITTGSTLKEIVRTIKLSTNAKVGVVTLALAKS
jgi:ComF family protein